MHEQLSLSVLNLKASAPELYTAPETYCVDLK